MFVPFPHLSNGSLQYLSFLPGEHNPDGFPPSKQLRVASYIALLHRTASLGREELSSLEKKEVLSLPAPAPCLLFLSSCLVQNTPSFFSWADHPVTSFCVDTQAWRVEEARFAHVHLSPTTFSVESESEDEAHLRSSLREPVTMEAPTWHHMEIPASLEICLTVMLSRKCAAR